MAVIARNGREDAGRRCEELLKIMEGSRIWPNYVTLSIIMNAWTHAKDKHAAHRCHAILQRMTYLYEEGREEMKPNEISYNTVVNAYAKCGMAEEAEQVLLELASDVNVEPTVVSFTTVMDAIAKKGTEEAAVKAQKILDIMLSTTSKQDVANDVVAFAAVITAWARSGARSAPERCEELVEKMRQHGVEPNVVAYNSLITAWARSGSMNAASKAEFYLDLMEQGRSSSSSSIAPNVISFSAVMDAWSRCKEKEAPERCEELLLRMKKLNIEPLSLR